MSAVWRRSAPSRTLAARASQALDAQGSPPCRLVLAASEAARSACSGCATRASTGRSSPTSAASRRRCRSGVGSPASTAAAAASRSARALRVRAAASTTVSEWRASRGGGTAPMMPTPAATRRASAAGASRLRSRGPAPPREGDGDGVGPVDDVLVVDERVGRRSRTRGPRPPPVGTAAAAHARPATAVRNWPTPRRSAGHDGSRPKSSRRVQSAVTSGGAIVHASRAIRCSSSPPEGSVPRGGIITQSMAARKSLESWSACRRVAPSGEVHTSRAKTRPVLGSRAEARASSSGLAIARRDVVPGLAGKCAREADSPLDRTSSRWRTTSPEVGVAATSSSSGGGTTPRETVSRLAAARAMLPCSAWCTLSASRASCTASTASTSTSSTSSRAAWSGSAGSAAGSPSPQGRVGRRRSRASPSTTLPGSSVRRSEPSVRTSVASVGASSRRRGR